MLFTRIIPFSLLFFSAALNSQSQLLRKIFPRKKIDPNAIELVNFQDQRKKVDPVAQNLLMKSARKGNIKMMNSALSLGARLNEKDEYGELPHLVAIMHGHQEIADYILDQQPELLNTQDAYGNSALTTAASFNRNTILANLLKRKKIKIDKKGHFGLTAFNWAATNFNLEGTKILLEHGANPDSSGICGETQLQHACHHRAYNFIKLLLKHGANPQQINSNTKYLDDRTPLDEAIEQHLDVTFIAEEMLESSLNERTFEKAAHANHLPLVCYLLNRGVFPPAAFKPSAHPKTVTSNERRREYLEIIRLLNELNKREVETAG